MFLMQESLQGKHGERHQGQACALYLHQTHPYSLLMKIDDLTFPLVHCFSLILGVGLL